MRHAVVLAMLLALACKSPEEKAQKARDELASWAATGQILANDWSRGAAKTPYVRSTVDVASDEVKTLGEALQNDKAKPSLDEVSRLYDQLKEAVDQNEQSKGQQISRSFAAIAAKLQQETESSSKS